uniref:Uncharacterized protein n=1 Tax=Rhizophora mucronata TaxID=61149 RepID=A0A2P2MYQ0_RHIMU
MSCMSLIFSLPSCFGCLLLHIYFNF